MSTVIEKEIFKKLLRVYIFNTFIVYNLKDFKCPLFVVDFIMF